ncbi:Rhodanese-like domain-containing protein [Lentinula raphanica]|nr:Rhodanese-like domain-containing protein [Lentinula raphanica]
MLLPAPSSPLGESSGDSSFDMTYAKRQQMKTIRRCDATAMIMNETGGMPGFGDNKTHGKILPCHRIADDGLMRITPETMDQLLDGHFEDHIRDYHIIDCRFDYEYAGGHIPGAVNINTASSVEDLLLGPSLMKPKPSVSGDTQKKTRAPTFAKHLRSKDRAMNNHVYPKIHYPELYILEGGYCSYFKRSAHRCEPPGYVCMDDPQQAVSRKGDLDQFRKNNPLFCRHRRGTINNGSLSTLSEDSHHTTEGDETDLDLGDSPCPPPTKSMALKTKKGTCATLSRAETYGPTRMPFLGC